MDEGEIAASDRLAAAPAERRMNARRRAATSPTAPTSTPARPGPRCAPTSSATCSSVQGQLAPRGAVRRRPAPVGATRRARWPSRARSPSSRTFSQRNGLYVFTINGFPYGTVPRRARQGGRLPARLARRRAPALHQSARRPAGRAAARRSGARGQHQHRARRIQAERATRRKRSRASPSICCGMSRTWSSLRSAPVAHRACARARAVLLSRDDRRDDRLLPRFAHLGSCGAAS